MSREAGENQVELKRQFLQAAQLGRDLVSESQHRQHYSLAPYLKPENFNPDTIASLKDQEQVSPEDITKAELASLSLALQAADQIVRAELPRPNANRALQPRVIQAEIESFQKIDSFLGKSFYQAKKMIQEGRAEEVIKKAREVIAHAQQTTPDKIKAGDEEILKWVENTIQNAGRRIRGHRERAQKLR